ncbi:hypothetical protein [Sabulicella glaciei]|uniref:Transporter n=1 Tax=Sabulicella glaciei TaxID=2984948 RepID=A0ABT3P0N9_9PROT|nr:hypothetical protein [Roseococcus sp. MDT2-1-1]MCW8087987.1 hypothetical protein [Roseococcus sp. MDT2-1-1]
MTRILAPAALLALLLPPPPALAQEEGIRPTADTPFSVRSAFPQERGKMGLYGFYGYSRLPGGHSHDMLPSLRLGIAQGLEFRLDAAHSFRDDRDRTTVTPGFRWQALEQRGWRPAVAILADVSVPLTSRPGTATELAIITSHLTGRGPGNWGLHLNAGWVARPDPVGAERRHGHRLGAAVSHVLDRDTLLVATMLHETGDRGQRDLHMVEAGFSRRLGQDLDLAFLAGTGLNRDSPRLRLRVGLKYSFSLGW